MAKGTPGRSTLAENIEVTSGLQAFRSIAKSPHQALDSPFGRSRDSDDPPVPVVEIIETGACEPGPNRKPLPKTRISPKKDETTGEDAPQLSLNEEKVTVPLSEALRDRAEELARLINRSRPVRKSRITRNSIIRVALQCFLDDFAVPAGRSVNSEEELLEAARLRRKR